MLKFNKNILTLILVLPIYISLFSQGGYFFDGYIIDTESNEALQNANVYIVENKKGIVSDSIGFFHFEDIAAGHYHVVVSHVGCASQQYHIDIQSDTTVHLFLSHSVTALFDVEVIGQKRELENTTTINEQTINDHATQNLGNLLESTVGVSNIKQGNTIAKPVVQGLYGNRLTILNNGIAQAGQQWGNDHSPEIDPLAARKIKLISGVDMLEYMGAHLGASILVEPASIAKEKHLHGRASYFFESNGFAHTTHLRVQHHNAILPWAATATFKRSGDKKTADYWLNNTGNQEINFSFLIEKKLSERLHLNLYTSTFNTKLGVLRGAHIGNLTDLEQALTRDIPFFTEEKFSYDIEAPMQKVHHHFVKARLNQFFNLSSSLTYTLAFQVNNRKEFDVRRSGRTDIAALDLKQYNIFAGIKYSHYFDRNVQLKTGVQFNTIDNTNNPNTGILPLIPDYASYQAGVFVTVEKNYDKIKMTTGLRYDNSAQKVAAISQSVPREILRYTDVFHSINSVSSFTHSPNSIFAWQYNFSFNMRPPAINEYYSNGLHQGVSGIERGTLSLETEKAIKQSLLLDIRYDKIFSVEIAPYFQYIDNYIYLRPENEFELTIRGAFPVFRYQQTRAHIYGIDLSAQADIVEKVKLKLGYNYIKGQNVAENIPLNNIPSSRITASIIYHAPILHLKKHKIENIAIGLKNRYTFEQKDFVLEQDFVLPPNGYNLLSLDISAEMQMGKNRWRWILTVDNMLNTKYRDYLNRQRYFADDMGLNITFGTSLKF